MHDNVRFAIEICGCSQYFAQLQIPHFLTFFLLLIMINISIGL